MYNSGKSLAKGFQMNECIFCKIASEEMDADTVYQDEQVTAFRDINPVAPTHILVIPNRHIASTNEVTEQDEQLLGHMLAVVKTISEQEGIAESGYRLIINTGPDANQVVFHLHLHIIGGQHMRHPMG
jgi:histidine triad (HIT) family protein